MMKRFCSVVVITCIGAAGWSPVARADEDAMHVPTTLVRGPSSTGAGSILIGVGAAVLPFGLLLIARSGAKDGWAAGEDASNIGIVSAMTLVLRVVQRVGSGARRLDRPAHAVYLT